MCGSMSVAEESKQRSPEGETTPPCPESTDDEFDDERCSVSVPPHKPPLPAMMPLEPPCFLLELT